MDVGSAAPGVSGGRQDRHGKSRGGSGPVRALLRRLPWKRGAGGLRLRYAPLPRLGKVEPLAEIGTDPGRWTSYTQNFAAAQNLLYAGYPWRFHRFHKTEGYANHPLDGIWARSPYLHNGSVPTLRDLLEPSARRPAVWYRGSDELDLVKVGYRSDAAAPGGSLFRYDTSAPRQRQYRARRPALRHRSSGLRQGRPRRIYEDSMTRRAVAQQMEDAARGPRLDRDHPQPGFVIPLLFCPDGSSACSTYRRANSSGRASRGCCWYPVGLLHPCDARYRPLSDLRLAGGVPVAHLWQRVLLSRGLRVRSAARLPGGRAARRVDRHRNALLPDTHRASRAGDRRGRGESEAAFPEDSPRACSSRWSWWRWRRFFCCCARWHSRRPTTSPQVFNHGSIGNEETQGLPFWIWRVLPQIFPEHLPGNRDGYGTFGVFWARGEPVPVGFSVKTLGVIPRVAPNCAFCHQGSYRLHPTIRPHW